MPLLFFNGNITRKLYYRSSFFIFVLLAYFVFVLLVIPVTQLIWRRLKDCNTLDTVCTRGVAPFSSWWCLWSQTSLKVTIGNLASENTAAGSKVLHFILLSCSTRRNKCAVSTHIGTFRIHAPSFRKKA